MFHPLHGYEWLIHYFFRFSFLPLLSGFLFSVNSGVGNAKYPHFGQVSSLGLNCTAQLGHLLFAFLRPFLISGIVISS
jgi:hypothetical protein